MLSINTNLSSLIAQSSMKQSTNKLNLAIERMSTGFKINHAKDNAANYSIATNMTTKINSYMVAEDNAAMGLDLISTAEGTLSQIQDKLSRLRALAEQSANGTYGEQSKQAINAEANALVDEIIRIADTSKYNGNILFNRTNRFLKDIEERDTSKMTKMGEVDEAVEISTGEYEISSAEDLQKLARMANNALIKGGEFVLANDIDLSEYLKTNTWTPIGENHWSEDNFAGTFDGNGHVISNLYINAIGKNCQGLFGSISGTIKNLGVDDAEIYANGETGVLVGSTSNNARIENCFVTNADVNGTLVISSFLGKAYGNTTTIESCYVENVTVVGAESKIGAFVGQASSKLIVNNTYAKGKVVATQNHYGIGGLLGNIEKDCEINNSFTDVDIFASSSEAVGGLIGHLSAGSTTIKNSYTLGDIEALYGAGGLVGNVFNNGTNLEIQNSYSMSSVEASDSKAGGLVGVLKDAVVVSLDNCYSLGSLNCPNSAGVLLGYQWSTSSTFETKNCYYDSKYESQGTNLVPSSTTVYDAKVYDSNKSAPFDFEKKNVDLQVGIKADDWSIITMENTFSLREVYKLSEIGRGNQDYLKIVDSLLNEVSNALTQYGAVSNRLESVLDEIAIQYDNLVSSRSTIRDADIAEVSASYIQQQILQQASATLLATANQSPSIALQLI